MLNMGSIWPCLIYEVVWGGSIIPILAGRNFVRVMYGVYLRLVGRGSDQDGL